MARLQAIPDPEGLGLGREEGLARIAREVGEAGEQEEEKEKEK
jgi:hypothetical protein